MKRILSLSIGILGLVGLAGSASIICSPSSALAEKGKMGEGQMLYQDYKSMLHKDIKLPLRNMALEIGERVDKLLDAILQNNFEAVKQNATAVSEKGHQIINTYFPQSLDIEAYKTHPETSHLKPEVLEEFKNLREDFLGYFQKIDASLQEIQKAADSKDSEAAFDAFSNLLKKTCIECHQKMR